METVALETFTRVVGCPYRDADGNACERELTVVLESGPPVVLVSISGCAHGDDENRKPLWRALESKSPYNPHVCRVQDVEARCRWCDGTGWYLRAAYLSKPHGLHDCDVCAESNLAKDLDFVPCSYCTATGKRAA